MPTPLQLDFPPGVVKTQSARTAKARYDDTRNVRFWRGKPQKWGGWTALALDGLLRGIVRGALTWSDGTARELIGAGTSHRLYAISDSDFKRMDITPLLGTASIANPFTMTVGSKIVTVSAPAHGVEPEQGVVFVGATSVGGLAMNGIFEVLSVVDINTFTVEASTAATSSAGPGGGTVSFSALIPPGLVNPAAGFGWGAGAWGEGTFGTPRDASGLVLTPRVWSLSNFGRVLIACFGDGPLYSWDPTVLPIQRAAQITDAPTIATGAVVTSDGIVIAFGTNYNPGSRDLMEVWNSAQGDYTNWDVFAQSGPNGAPSRVNRLRRGTRIVAAGDLGNHVTLMWTNTALYGLQYTGSTFVFNYALAGTECGLIGPLAFVIVGTTAYWMGIDRFHMFSGGVQDVPNQDDVAQWVADRVKNAVKSVCWYNKRFGEVYWAFATTDAGEPDTYVSYNIDGKFWTNGKVTRTSATSFQGTDSRPLLFGPDGKIYRHDDGLDADGAPLGWYLSASGIDAMGGAREIEVDSFAPDMERQVGTIDVRMIFTDRAPDDTLVESEAIASFPPNTAKVDARGQGREVALEFIGDGLGCDFRMGLPRLVHGVGAERE